MTELIELDSPESLQTYKQETNPIVLIVYGENCNPCKQLKEYLREEVISENSNVLFLALNGTKNRDWAVSQSIRTVPTIFIYSPDLQSKTTIVGFTSASKEQFQSNLKRALSNAN